MKKLLLMLTLSSITVAVWAQSDVRTATLQKSDTTLVFKGASAFVEAHNAAVDGDVITLSDGSFTATNITKSVTIYGAGFEQNEETGTAISTINGNVYIGVTDATLCDVKLEGLYINGTVYAANTSSNSTTAQIKNFTMKKCRVAEDIRFNSNIESVNILQCRTNYIAGTKTAVANGLLVANCYIEKKVIIFSTQSDVLLDHCIIGWYYNGYNMGNDEMNYSAFTWTNCILLGGGGYSSPRSTGMNCVVKNCVCSSGWGTDIGVTYENCYQVNPANLFADASNASYTENRTFELADPETYVGTDGTPVGPAGGLGWSKVPATPVVKSLDLEVNGTTLNVTYEAEVRE